MHEPALSDVIGRAGEGDQRRTAHKCSARIHREQSTPSRRAAQREWHFFGGKQHHHAGRALVCAETTGSAARMGITGAALGIGGVLSAVLAGPLVDRLGFKRASVLADIAADATVAAVPLLYGAGILRFWELLVLVFLLSSINTPGDSARFALIPALARQAAMSVERGNAADRAIARLRPDRRSAAGRRPDHLAGCSQRPSPGRCDLRRFCHLRGSRRAVLP
jgi:hypothetical protein